MVLDKVGIERSFDHLIKISTSFHGPHPNSRSYQDDYLNSRPFEQCVSNHDYFFFDTFLLVTSTIVVYV